MRPLLSLCLIVAASFLCARVSPQLCLADDVETSRTYGKMYVIPIAVGQFPPVMVTKELCGPAVKQDAKTMRAVSRPSIMVFCKDLNSDSLPMLTSLSSCAQRLELPLFVSLTLEKGVAGDNTQEFDPIHYLQRDEIAALASRHKQLLSGAALSRATVGIAVNRFWRDSIGYAPDSDMIVTYVRKNVLLIRNVQVSKGDEHFRDELLESIEQLHQTSKPPAIAK